ncbi:MAG: hypothetical protein DRO87_11190 [Candidatus Thorarchaeota archaeon]|nr:MAG: hypothetical protein DRO87_11190 [Candidatus Thorarchaeota archaeon]
MFELDEYMKNIDPMYICYDHISNLISWGHSSNGSAPHYGLYNLETKKVIYESYGVGRYNALFRYNDEPYFIKTDDSKIYTIYRIENDTMIPVITFDFGTTNNGYLNVLKLGKRIIIVRYDKMAIWYPELGEITVRDLSVSASHFCICPYRPTDTRFFAGNDANKNLRLFGFRLGNGYTKYIMNNVKNIKRIDWNGSGYAEISLSNDNGNSWSDPYIERRNNVSIDNPIGNPFQIKVHIYDEDITKDMAYIDNVIVHYNVSHEEEEGGV